MTEETSPIPEFTWRVTMFEDEDDISIDVNEELSELGVVGASRVVGNSLIQLGTKMLMAVFQDPYDEDEILVQQAPHVFDKSWDAE